MKGNPSSKVKSLKVGKILKPCQRIIVEYEVDMKSKPEETCEEHEIWCKTEIIPMTILL